MLDIKQDVILAPYTTFRIGGPAKFFVEVESADAFGEAIEFANEKNIPFFILGGGSNILISDKGFTGLVIKIDNKSFVSHDVSIGCGSGLPLAKFVKESIAHELSGAEWAAGIPGTIGGAIRGNAGAFGSKISDIIRMVNFIDMQDLYEELAGKKVVKIKTFGREQCEFSYRDSIFKRNNNLIILSASFEFKRGTIDEINERMKESIKNRTSQQPHGASAGSFFKNPESTEQNRRHAKEIPRFKELNLHEKNTIPAGFLIEEAGLKGKKIGGAMVSQEHANFILNTGDATAEDVIMLTSFIKQQVRDDFGVQLQEEIQYVGF